MKLEAIQGDAEVILEVSELTEEEEDQDPQEYETARRREKDLWQTEVYDMKSCEWMADQRKASRIMEEKSGFKHPVKRLLGRRRRAKWGEWENLYMEEEEL